VSSNFEIQLLQRLRATLRFPAFTKMVADALAEQLTASQISLLGSGSVLPWITIYTSILGSPLFPFQLADSASHHRSDLFVLSFSTFHGSSVGLVSWSYTSPYTTMYDYLKINTSKDSILFQYQQN
jgi:hypothetical protein